MRFGMRFLLVRVLSGTQIKPSELWKENCAEVVDVDRPLPSTSATASVPASALVADKSVNDSGCRSGNGNGKRSEWGNWNGNGNGTVERSKTTWS